jgi:predicted ribosome quality control (RQC) complex YloA/Tae2 family protein
MNEPTLSKISAELSEHLIGQKFGKIFALSKFQLAIDFRLSSGKFLFISIEPNAPRVYIIKRKLRDLEKQSKLQLPFVSFLRKRLAHATLDNIKKVENERILSLNMLARDDFGNTQNYDLVIQLTGRSSNLFLLDDRGYILDSLRDTFGSGQELASQYKAPSRDADDKKTEERKIIKQSAVKIFPQGGFETISEALDNFYQEKQRKQTVQAKIQSARARINRELKKKRVLNKNLSKDLIRHGDAAKWKRFGDLLLANISTAKRTADKITVVDYFDETIPTIEIKADRNLSISEAAEKYFKRYTKARNAKAEISKRLEVVDLEIDKLEKKKAELELAIKQNDLEKIESFVGKKKKQKQPSQKGKKDSGSYYREFISTDGFEILVGKRSKDNDYLTFRIAKSLDTWMHAADYPGSHVVIRNPNRKEIPHQTLIEAAQLAAFYSKAKNELKVGVHYTQKKFVNKPKGAAAGLVSLSSFKTILVEPKISATKKSI